MYRVFLLSPANCGGTRGVALTDGRLRTPLADQLRAPGGATMGEVFSFVSALYFRGKLAYARHFGRPPHEGDGALVITPTSGLQPPDTRLTIADLQKFARVDVHEDNPRYRRPLERSARALEARIDASTAVVLLGSIATAKYVDVLLDVFGSRLHFPAAFVGRGDMSRGGLMLRAVADDSELAYAPVTGAVRHGPRPPKLEKLPRARVAARDEHPRLRADST
jgi:hypothetical protein